MTFLHPHAFWLLLVVALLPLVEEWTTRRDRGRLGGMVDAALWPKVVRRPRERWRRVRMVLLVLGGAAFVVALARPQFGLLREKVEREGADVVILLDTSLSMSTADAPPNRFFLAKASLLELVAARPGDRFALVAFEGEAYPLVPLTLDADAVGLFLDTLEPGAVPGPGSSLKVGIEKGLEMFVDKERRHKVLVLVSDGEDLEGDVEVAVRRAKEAGVVIHCVGVGTESGGPVPQLGPDGEPAGFKKDDEGQVVVSRAHPETLEAIARGTGGKVVRVGAAQTSLLQIVSALEGMEKTTAAKEYSIRGREWYQVPLAVGIVATLIGLLLPLPLPRRWRRAAVAALLPATLLAAAPAHAQQQPMPPMPAGSSAAPPPVDLAPRTGAARLADELLLRPMRGVRAGAKEFELGKHPGALDAFAGAARSRPDDPRIRFDLGDALYKNGRYDEAEATWKPIAEDETSALAPAARHNIGNARYQKQDFGGAAKAYRDALRLRPDEADTKRNLELALRALAEQKQQQQREQERKQDQKKEEEKKQPPPESKPKDPEQKEREKWEKETGMPKDRAMQLLDALSQQEKDEQKKQMAKVKSKRKGKDW